MQVTNVLQFQARTDNLSQKAALLLSNTQLCRAPERAVRDFHSAQKSDKCTLIFKHRVDLDFPNVRRFCLEVKVKIESLLVEKNNAFTYFKSEREPEVEFPFQLEPVRPQELA